MKQWAKLKRGGFAGLSKTKKRKEKTCVIISIIKHYISYLAQKLGKAICVL